MVLKIPLFKSKSLGFERDMVTFSVKYGSLPNFYATAIIDTGCPFCMINQNSINKTRISYKNKPSYPDPLLVGGIKLNLKDLGDSEINFKDVEGNVKTFKQKLYVGVPITNPNESLLKQIPCFIGNDFLDDNFLSIQKTRERKNYLVGCE